MKSKTSVCYEAWKTRQILTANKNNIMKSMTQQEAHTMKVAAGVEVGFPMEETLCTELYLRHIYSLLRHQRCPTNKKLHPVI